LWQPVGFADNLPCQDTATQFDLPHLGDDAEVLAASATLSDRWYVLGIGNVGPATIRRAIISRYGPEAAWATIVHASAIVSPRARLGAGTVVMAGAVINAGTVVGEHAIINTGAILEHDCRIGAFGHVGPGAIVGGGTTVGAGSFLGLGCRVRDHLTLGPETQVGMGAVVVADLATGVQVWGVPARPRIPQTVRPQGTQP
ncbi:MAG: NeuD/PglB/VioB family sugar acetyltransferase, partial [Candidatus Sericytochromatia bacterium]|nr:NeuD/PglB/VioB family sugar acetyltransferase [Candidatus Sericytochromatia bacterium]